MDEIKRARKIKEIKKLMPNIKMKPRKDYDEQELDYLIKLGSNLKDIAALETRLFCPASS